MKNRIANEVQLRIKEGGHFFGKHNYLKNKYIPIHLIGQVFNQFILPTLTYGYQKTELKNQKSVKEKRKGKSQAQNLQINSQTQILEKKQKQEITNLKWEWAGHVACMKDNRWTVRCIEWQVKRQKKIKRKTKKKVEG